jgi:hypothetical protein
LPLLYQRIGLVLDDAQGFPVLTLGI